MDIKDIWTFDMKKIKGGVGGGIVGGVDREVDGLVGRRAGAMGGGCVRWQGPGAVALLLVVCAALLPVCLEASLEAFKYSTRLVRTKYGPLRGLLLQQPPVEAFLGVPYATPPTGALRYMPPVTPSMWRTPRLADAFSPVCPQRQPDISNRSEALLRLPRGRLAHLERLLPLLLNQSEDCLYLNIYVPRTGSPSDHQGAIPCLLYVHGESYEWNSGNPYDGSVLASHGHIIVVTINFRLGILGFLKTGSRGSAQGNFGLMDVVAGLHWLRENLPAFGGDPERITLMGHGTGAALANYIAVSPVAKELLHRVILLSGSG
ncbi:neuroligin-4, X-linked-like, partial [Nilaparvata lugens]|uniref:neuroligin-4, X-linked-like n=1 Tax=Nilaparvata lugens TaxID=108931 RepID=UPI00193DE0C3